MLLGLEKVKQVVAVGQLGLKVLDLCVKVVRSCALLRDPKVEVAKDGVGRYMAVGLKNELCGWNC